MVVSSLSDASGAFAAQGALMEFGQAPQRQRVASRRIRAGSPWKRSRRENRARPAGNRKAQAKHTVPGGMPSFASLPSNP